MFRTGALSFLIGLTVVLPGPVKAAADGPQGFGDPWKICESEVLRAERSFALPGRLLSAISLAESGRWNPDKKENIAWPWTVTSQGQGKFFPTKEKAVAFVRRLQGRGVTNIDVGCMQINLYYHRAAFPSLEHAFDPDSNADYAARLLKDNFKKARSWTQAAADYHSTTPDLNRAYKLKVLSIWNRERRLARAARSGVDGKALMARLKKNRASRPSANTSGSLRRNQIDAWRSERIGQYDMATQATMRRVRLIAAQRKKWEAALDAEKEDLSAEKRRKYFKKRRARAQVVRAQVASAR